MEEEATFSFLFIFYNSMPYIFSGLNYFQVMWFYKDGCELELHLKVRVIFT